MNFRGYSVKKGDTPKIIIQVENGAIVDVICHGQPVDILLIDHDTDGESAPVWTTWMSTRDGADDVIKDFEDEMNEKFDEEDEEGPLYPNENEHSERIKLFLECLKRGLTLGRED